MPQANGRNAAAAARTTSSAATSSIADSAASSPCIGIPKPKKADRPYLQRRRETKRRDKAFQTDMPHGAKCVVPGCTGAPGKHHRRKRQHRDTRWDDSNAVAICYWPHHVELEAMGEEKFCKKYGLQFPLPTLKPASQ